MEQCLKVQEQLGTELQKELKKLSDKEKEQEKVNETRSEEIQRLEEELKDLQGQTEEKVNELKDAEAQVLSLEKIKAELEHATKEAEVKIKILNTNTSNVFLPPHIVSYLTPAMSFKNNKLLYIPSLDSPGDSD